MEFASQRTCALALVGLAFLMAAGCHHGRPTGPGDAGARPDAIGPNFTLEGRVTDEAGRALPEARVLAFGPLADAGPIPRHEARTDLGGRFTVGGLPRGRYSLVVEAVGLATIEPPAVDVPRAAADLQLRLAGQGRSLPGVVTAAGAPVAGARVRLGGEGGTLARQTVSDEAGRFVFHGLGAGAYALRATKGLLTSPVVGNVRTNDGAAAPREPARLELETGMGIEGVVVDDGGHGLPRVGVRAEIAPDDPLGESVSTLADGRFRVGPLPPGRYRLVGRGAGYLLRAPAHVALAVGAPNPPARLELVRAASVAGRVVDARGLPVVGAQIRCGGGGAELTDLAVIFDPLPLAAEAATQGGSFGPARGATKLARSDARGAFVLEELLPGPVHLFVTRAPLAPLETEAASLAPGERRDLGALTLRDAETADAGVAPPAAPTRGDATLEGVARDSGNRPLARARVRAWPLGAGEPGLASAPRAPATASAVTDPGGHFTLGNVPRAPLLVEVDHAAYPVTVATATPGTPAELTIPIPGGIDGDVREHVTGASVPRASVEGLGPEGQRARGAVKKGGASFRLTRLRPGHWTLTAKAPGYRAAVRDVDVPESPTLGETSVRGLRLELELDR